MVDYPYEIITPPASLPLNLATFKEHLKIEGLNLESDDYLTLLLQAVTAYAERYTHRTFINTTFMTYRDYFVRFISHKLQALELRRSKLQSIDFIRYYKDDSLETVDSTLYYFTKSNDYSLVLPKRNETWPSNIDNRLQAIQIQFIAGLAANATAFATLYPDLQIALLNHATKVYENRGDCDPCNTISLENLITRALPDTAKIIYELHMIKNITGMSQISYNSYYHYGYL